VNFEPPILTICPGKALQWSKQAEFAVILKMNPMFATWAPTSCSESRAFATRKILAWARCCSRKAIPADALFGVRRGQIRIETGASDGSRLTLNFLGPGDLFGEVAVLDGESRTADATAGEPTELFVLRREDFPRPSRARAARRDQADPAFVPAYPLDERADGGIRAAAAAGSAGAPALRVGIRFRLRGAYLAGSSSWVFVGAARESVNRQLQQWRKEGILDLQRGRILLQNMTKLTAVARNE